MNLKEEIEKCQADPVYFYENYLTIDGMPAPPMAEESKRAMRLYFNSRNSGRTMRFNAPSNSRVMFKRTYEADVESLVKKKLN